MDERILGCKDVPIENIIEDDVMVLPYVQGLASFINECDTPMAVSVQGEWGCGKTSAMQMVRKLEEKTFSLWFDAWEYTQFHNEENVAVTFMEYVLEGLCKNKNELPIPMDKVKKILSGLVINVTRDKLGDNAGDVVESLLEKEEPSFSKKMYLLKDSFLNAFKEYAEQGLRVVIYIDNLDRIRPAIAVELLEIAKLFFDVENCVFVIAVDSDVVFQGIQEKYGSDISHEKAKSFFDKIIQLPFTLPVSQYKLDSMLDRIINCDADYHVDSYIEKEWYFRVLYKYTKGNPRSIKRFSNLYLLNDHIQNAVGKKVLVSERNKGLYKRLRFWLTGLNMNYPQVYSDLLVNVNFAFLETFVYEKETVHSRKEMLEILTKLEFPGVESFSEELLDLFVMLYQLLEEYNETIGFYFTSLFDWVGLISQIPPRTFSQPATVEELKQAQSVQYTHPKDIVLIDRIDTVLQCNGFIRKDTSFASDFKYEYFLGDKKIFTINQYYRMDVFPKVSMHYDFATCEDEEMCELWKLCISNMQYRYKTLQEQYGKTLYPDIEFNEKKFVLYSQLMVDEFINGMQLIGNLNKKSFSA